MGIGYSVHALLCELRQRRRYRPVPPQPGGQCEYLQSDRGRVVPDRTSGTTGDGCLATATATPLLNANGCTRGPWNRPARGTFGNVARNSFFGPRFFNTDASLSKRFQFTERVQGQFRAEMFNTFNHVNLGQPNAQVDSPTAGQIFAIASLSQMRKWQFGLRVQF